MKSAFCPTCHAESPVVEVGGQCSCAHCESSLLLRDRWWLSEMLGHGASGYTWKGVDRDDGSVVAIKELSFRRLTDLKQLELFQREADALASLDHGSIPDFYEQFVVEEDRFVSAYLVQEFIDGGVLELSSRIDEEEVLRFLEQMADVLDHLQSRRPPVIHRDIKPSNVMRRRDGRYVLIDFGSIRAAAEATMGGSTVAGTLGYMAPEQLVGRASVGSDYYGLGATALAMLAGREAHHLIEHHRPGAWRDRVKLSDGMAEILSRLLEVDVDRRLKTPRGLREAIEEVRRPPAPAPSKVEPPSSRESSSPGVKLGLRAFAPSLIGLAVVVPAVLVLFDWLYPVLFSEVWFRLTQPGGAYVLGWIVSLAFVILLAFVFAVAYVSGPAALTFVTSSRRGVHLLIPLAGVAFVGATIEGCRHQFSPPRVGIFVMEKGAETRFLLQHRCGFTVIDESYRVVGMVDYDGARCRVDFVDGRFVRIRDEAQLIYAHAWDAKVTMNLAEDLENMGGFRIVDDAGTRALVEMQDGSRLHMDVVLSDEHEDMVFSGPLEAGELPTVYSMEKGSEMRYLFQQECGFTIADEAGETVATVEHWGPECRSAVSQNRFLWVSAEDQILWAHAWDGKVFSDLAESLSHMGPFRVLQSAPNGGAVVRLEDGSELPMRTMLDQDSTDLVLSPGAGAMELHRAEVVAPAACGRAGGPLVKHFTTAFGEGEKRVSRVDAVGRPQWTLEDPPPALLSARTFLDVDGECWFFVAGHFWDRLYQVDRDTGEVSRVRRF